MIDVKLISKVKVNETHLRLGDVNNLVAQLKEDGVLGRGGTLQAAESLRAESEAAPVWPQSKQNTPNHPPVAFLKAHPEVDVT